MKTTFLLLFCAFMCFQRSYAQSDSTKAHKVHFSHNNFYGEYKGPTGWYSVNYERILRFKKLPFCFLAGSIGYYNIDYERKKWRAIPCRVKLCVGWRQFFGEVGYCNVFAKKAGTSFIHPDEFYPFRKVNLQFVTFGLRYQPLHRGLYVGIEAFPVDFSGHGDKYTFSWHIDKNPYKLENEGKKVFWWGGLSVGYSF